MTHTATHDKEVPDFVVAKYFGPGIRAFGVIDDKTQAVNKATQRYQEEAPKRNNVNKIGEENNRQANTPTEEQVDADIEKAVDAMAQELIAHTQNGRQPDDAQCAPTPPAREKVVSHRGVGAGNEQEDRHVIQPIEPKAVARPVFNSVKEGAGSK